ncbi:hypothetical protein HDU81_009045 [Chytriomyces hyalinus]|nr:hypothetical protein HDU81_009045 [Chytriomyces hyalinus]
MPHLASLLLIAAVGRAVTINGNQMNGGHFNPSLDSDNALTAASCSKALFPTPTDTCFSFTSSNSISIIEFNSLNGAAACTNLKTTKLYCFSKAVIASENVPTDSSSETAKGDTTSTTPETFSNGTIPQPNPIVSCSGVYSNLGNHTDNCSSLESAFRLSASDFMALNPAINCANGITNTTVCFAGTIGENVFSGAAGRVTAVNNTLAPTHPIEQCTRNINIGDSETCGSISSKFQVTVTQLAAWNFNLNCWNLTVGSGFCVDSSVSPSLSSPLIATQDMSEFLNKTATSASSKSVESSPTTKSTAAAEPTTAADAPAPIQPPEAVPEPVQQAPAPPSVDPAPVVVVDQEPTPQSATDNTNMSAADKSAMLAAHNNFRAQYGIAPLTFDDSIGQSTAASWAATLASQGCALQHGNNDGLGQNLYMQSSSGRAMASMQDMFNAWSSESLDEGMNHATQALWYSTTKVGCAIQWGNGGRCEVLVCNYSPPGNMMGYTFSGGRA